MIRTYILKHNGNNGHPNVCTEQEQFFRLKKIPIDVLNWPTGSGSGISSGDEEISEVKSRYDFSTIRKPSIMVNGRGELHGRTFFFVDSLNQDLTYYQIDAHMDTGFVEEGELGCENHIHQTMQLPHVKKINLLGINPFNLKDDLGYHYGDDDGYFEFAPTPAIVNPKVELFLGESWDKSKERVQKNKARITFNDDVEYRIALLEKYGRKYLIEKEFNPALDPTSNAYISIDLDVIKKFPTGWPKAGIWTTEKVIDTIHQIGQYKQIIGADICGLCLISTPERPLSLERKESALEDIARIHSALVSYMN